MLKSVSMEDRFEYINLKGKGERTEPYLTCFCDLAHEDWVDTVCGRYENDPGIFMKFANLLEKPILYEKGNPVELDPKTDVELLRNNRPGAEFVELHETFILDKEKIKDFANAYGFLLGGSAVSQPEYEYYLAEPVSLWVRQIKKMRTLLDLWEQINDQSVTDRIRTAIIEKKIWLTTVKDNHGGALEKRYEVFNLDMGIVSVETLSRLVKKVKKDERYSSLHIFFALLSYELSRYTPRPILWADTDEYGDPVRDKQGVVQPYYAYSTEFLLGGMYKQFESEVRGVKKTVPCKNPKCSEFVALTTKPGKASEYHSNKCYKAHCDQVKGDAKRMFREGRADAEIVKYAVRKCIKEEDTVRGWLNAWRSKRHG